MPTHKDLAGDELHPPKAHASSHTGGADDIQAATATQKGLMTATQVGKLNGIASGADKTQSAVAAATAKTALVDGDLLAALDSEDSNTLVTVSLSDLKAFLKTYFDTVYAPIS
ncbi:hypothetical protein HTZ97_16550 [Desulfuromonas acetoxidans]|uniref:Uncharacterized protein n=1 Tax=Desulfuromonas acetoxidans (strain DSM 684 / 11070) TaxID=281689 RepID=Q1K082_DESA6|nr:hypothetical protein [Desulfuromonas acetoxidans]EAT16059.1 hypothetical protein Dace_2360 [Desulfuromonas acetoxidans DSM 684]MBF0647083.1 hypothetical protein [Desulfuromonas acetoxidans]NVD26204.1 hypothetical protein [Desulfuromonas acetoxidans]NVE18068.1 hypothetical protein [Desulfuromonas acetoxidans]